MLGVEVSALAIDEARATTDLMGLNPALMRFETGDVRVLGPTAGRRTGRA